MKTILALMTLLAVATVAHAQNTDTQSDSYLCYHGSATDPKTDAACQRVEAAASQPVAPVVAKPKSGQNGPQDASAGAASPNPASSAADKAKPAAAAPAVTDVGEEPLNAAPADETNSDKANAEDNSGTDVSINGSWLAGMGAFAIIAVAIACFVGLAVYFIPTIIAIARHKRSALGIFLVNLLLGWSFIGWVAALVWSLMSET